MGYIESSLINGENIVYQTKLHWIIFLRAVILSIITTLFYMLGLNNTGTFFLIISILVAVGTFINYLSSVFAITNKKIVGKTGFIRRNSLEVLLPNVESIRVDRGMLGRILNFGAVIVTKTDGIKQPFYSIPAPENCRKIAQEQISITKK